MKRYLTPLIFWVQALAAVYILGTFPIVWAGLQVMSPSSYYRILTQDISRLWPESSPAPSPPKPKPERVSTTHHPESITIPKVPHDNTYTIDATTTNALVLWDMRKLNFATATCQVILSQSDPTKATIIAWNGNQQPKFQVDVHSLKPWALENTNQPEDLW